MESGGRLMLADFGRVKWELRRVSCIFDEESPKSNRFGSRKTRGISNPVEVRDAVDTGGAGEGLDFCGAGGEEEGGEA